MKSMIDKFFDFENEYLKEINRGEEYDNIKDDINVCVSDLKERLSENLYPMIDEIVYQFFRMQDEAEKASYKAGFKAGMSVTFEALKH